MAAHTQFKPAAQNPYRLTYMHTRVNSHTGGVDTSTGEASTQSRGAPTWVGVGRKQRPAGRWALREHAPPPIAAGWGDVTPTGGLREAVGAGRVRPLLADAQGILPSRCYFPLTALGHTSSAPITPPQSPQQSHTLSLFLPCSSSQL